MGSWTWRSVTIIRETDHCVVWAWLVFIFILCMITNRSIYNGHQKKHFFDDWLRLIVILFCFRIWVVTQADSLSRGPAHVPLQESYNLEENLACLRLLEERPFLFPLSSFGCVHSLQSLPARLGPLLKLMLMCPLPWRRPEALMCSRFL